MRTNAETRVFTAMFSTRVFCNAAAAAAFLLSNLHASSAVAQHATTPRAGSIERKQILDAIRPAPNSAIRFIVHSLRIIKGPAESFAYAAVEPSRQEYDGGEYILQRTGGQWRVIWAVTGGGANACADIADYYRSAAQYLKEHGIAAETLNPGHTSETKRQTAAAAADQDRWIVGDSGPEIGNSGA